MLPIFEPVNSAWPLIGLFPFTLLAHECNPFLTFFSGLTYSSLQLHVLNYNISAAAAAKWLQSCPTLCDPIDGNPPGSAIPGILQARTLEWVAIAFSEYLCYSRINWIFGISWRREWQSTPVFLPGEFHERGSLAGSNPWDHKESDMTERLTYTHIWYLEFASAYLFSFRLTLHGAISGIWRHQPLEPLESSEFPVLESFALLASVSHSNFGKSPQSSSCLLLFELSYFIQDLDRRQLALLVSTLVSDNCI